MAGDKFDQLYNALKADGAVSGTREHFRQFVYAPGKQGYHNRKQLYDALHADGAVSSKSYEEFAQRLGLHAVNPKPQQKAVAQQKPMTTSQRAQEVAAQYQKGKQTKQPVDYLHRPQSQMGRLQRNVPAKASSFVRSLYEIDNAQKGPDYSVDYTSPKATQQVYQQNQHVRKQAAQSASDHIANDEYRRQSQPMIDNGTVGVMKPMGEIEQEMSDSASRFVDANLGDYINNAVLGEQNAAGKRAVDAYNNSFAAGGGGGGGINDLLMRSLAYNEENDPDKMIENLAKNARGGLEKLFQNPSFVAKVKNEADMLGVTPEAYVESILPHLKDRLSAALEKSEYNKYLPKDALENMANRFIDSNTIGKLVRGATMTRGQRIMQERASAATAAGENPYYKGSTVENVVADVAGMVSDPVFKGAAGAGGKVAGKLIGNNTKLAALMANGNLAQRLMAKGAQAVTSGGVTGFVFDSTGSVIQNYSTGEDTSLGNTLKVAAKGGTTGAVNFATMSLAGIPLSEVGRSIGLKAVKGESFWGNTGRATAKIGLESGKTYMEAMGMYLGGYVSGKLEGRTDANGKPIEFDLWNGTMESLPTAIGFRLQHAVEGLRGGRKNEKGEDMGWFGSTIANFKDFLTSDKAKESRFLMTDDERNQIFSSGAMNGLMPDGENIVSYAKRTKNKKVSYEDPYLETDASMIKNTYDQIMADPKVSWDAKAKFSAMVTGIMPSARPMMDYITYSSEDYVKDGLLRGKRKYVNEYSAKGELLSKIPYDSKVDRDNVVYKHNIVRENQRLYNAMGLLARQDRNNYELQNDFFVENMKKPGADVNILVTNMGDEGSHVFRDFSLFALNSEKGTVLKTIYSVAVRNGMKSEDLIKAMKKNPMKRSDFEQNVCVELRRALEAKAFPDGKVHVEQSNLNGKDVAEDNNLGTEQPNGDAVKQELNGLRQAEEEVEVLMRDNDVFSQNFKKLQSQGLTNPQIYDWMVQQGGLTVEQLEPFAHYINANARVQGMQEATKQKIENVASSFVQDWSYKDTLNGVGMVNADGSAETVLFVYHDGKELIVGSGDVSFNQPNEYGIRRAKEDVGDMLVCFDPQTGQMVYVHASEVDYSREMKPEELKAKKILELQNINSVPYNEAAQEQAMQDAAENQDQSESGKGNDASETPEIVSEATPVETPTDFSFNNGKGRINSYKATPHEKTKSDGTKEITFSSEVTFTKGAPKGRKEGEVINIGNGGGFIKIDPIDIDYQQYAVSGRLHDDGTAFSKDEATSEDIAEAKEMIDTLLTPQLAEEMGPQYNVKKIIIAPDGRVFAKFIGMDGNIPLKRNPLEKAPQDDTTKSEDSTTKEGNLIKDDTNLTKDNTTLTKVDTTSGEDNTTNEDNLHGKDSDIIREFDTKRGKHVVVRKVYSENDKLKVTKIEAKADDGTGVSSVYEYFPLPDEYEIRPIDIEAMEEGGTKVLGVNELRENKRGTYADGTDLTDAGAKVVVKFEDGSIGSLDVGLIRKNVKPAEQPHPSRKFADGTEVPMTTDSKGRPTPDYASMTPEQSAEILTEDFGENAEKVVDGQIQKAEKALKDAEKMKVDYTAEPNDIMEQEALKKKTVEAAKKQLDHAQNIKKAMTAKKVAETVGKTERTEGAHEAGSVAAQKFVNAPRLIGNKRTRMLPDGETKINGHYEIVPAESLTPSHDVNNGYKKSEGFPTDAEGRTVNDRDYEHDKAAQQNTDQIARKYNGMAIEQVPVVSDEGIVYDGNGRTMAGQKAAKEGTDGEYINDLLENAENFGFTREQIEQSGIEHPRLVLVTDERLPYDTATFAKFNRNEKKTQSNTEQAVAKAKTLTSDEVGAIVAEIEGNGSLEAFFNNSKAINDLVKTLVDKGIIGQNEVAQMMDSPERLSAQGREYVKNLLLGSIFKPETIRMLGIDSTVKNKAINAIRSVMDNMKLGEFSLRDEIDQAIQLLYEARQGGNKVDTLLRTPSMFGEDAAKRYPSISQMMALALEGKVADFRDLLDEYNRIAAARNTGEGNVFGEAPTKPELIKEFLDFKKWQDYGTGHSENERGNDVSGVEKPQQEASGGNEPAEAGEGRVKSEDEDKTNSVGFTPKEIRDHKEKLDRAKDKYVKALSEAKSEKEIKAAEDEFEFTYKDHQNMTGVLDEASVADMWKKELKSAKDSVKKDSKKLSADPMEALENAANAFHEEQKKKTEFKRNLEIGKARQEYDEAKKKGNADEISHAAGKLRNLLNEKYKAQGMGFVHRYEKIAEEIGKAEAEIIDKPWEQMDLEEREAVSSKNPLTESEINELTSEENKELIPAALAYLRGDKGNIINAISYFKIWNDVRNRHENVSDNSGTENGTQLDAADTTGGEGLGLGRGRESGRPDGPVDRGAGNEAAPGERNGREGDQNDTTLSAGEQGNKQGEGNSSGMGAVPAGSSDTNGGGSASGNGHVSGGSGRESSKRPADTNAGRKPTAKQGTTFPDSTAERLKQERADYEKKKKDFWARWKKAGQGYAKIALTPFKKLNLTPEQIEMLPELFKMHLNGAVLKIKEGIYKFNEWKAAMLAEEGEELKMIGLSDDDIDRFIEDYWNTPYEMDGETHTIREWSSIYGNQQLKKKLKEPLEEKYKRQMEAEPIEVKVGDMKNIEETLPYLLPQQQEDVLKAETQFFGKEHSDREHAYGKGYLFTNGTGTGKTYTGLGIAKRLANQGKGRILFITPSQKKVSDWIKDGRNLGLDIKDLDSWAKERGTTATNESGEGMVITTFANFGLNKKLLETEWDAVIYDECHRIMENKKGTETARSMQHYMITNRDENHCFRRLQSINPEYQKMNTSADKFNALRQKEIDRIKKEYKDSHPSATDKDVVNATLKSLPRDLNSFATADGMTFPKLGKAYQDFIKARDAYNKVEPKLKEQAKDSWKNTKTIFLSATPFNTRENLDYVEGYIFKYPETDERGMGGRTQFYLNHFGAAYKFRYHRLEQSISNPDAVAKQEVAFSDYLQNTLRTMSGRIIDSPYDYSRDFPTVAPDHAEDFNNAVQDTLKTKYLHDAYSKTIGDYNYGSALFETMKVSAAIDRIKQHLDLGRKVVIFHRRVESKEPLEAPFAYMLRVANEQIKMMKPGKERNEYIKECTEFRNKYADLLEWEKTIDYSMPREQIAKVFGEKNVLFFSGKESKKVKDKAIDTFNDDDSGKNIIVIQEASGKEGISLHDTTSKHQRVCITLALPQSPITALQIEGRIYRIGNMSNAIFEYPILGLNSEMMLFGEKFNNQVSTTENLALGSKARNLRDSFANGILEHSGIVPVENQGVGGKEFDAATPSENDPFDNAVLDYYSNQKLNKNNREGSDYFPTPEPLGYKMVEWAGLGEGDSVLEPSAGHGAIARYVPKTNEMVSIEPSQSLFTKLQLKAGGLGRKFLNNTFENYALNNKHDVIVMNPPFGKAGALAIQHVDKAFKHLDEGGRIVAIIPRGSTDKKFDKWYNEQKNVAMRAEVNLPDILFQQAGTRVACRVVVLDKISDAALRSKAGYPEKIDLSGHYDKIEDFFNDLRDIEMPERIIDTNLKMQKKAKAAVKDIMEIKGVKNVSYGKTGIDVSLTGSWMNYGISFTGSDKPNYWRDKMANYYTKYDELQKLEYQENKQSVFDELKKLSCKLSGMTEDEMQRYIASKSNGGTHFREDRGLQYSKTDAKDVKNSRIIPEDVDKNVSSQIEKKFDDEINRLFTHVTPSIRRWANAAIDLYSKDQTLNSWEVDENKNVTLSEGLNTVIDDLTKKINEYETKYGIRKDANIGELVNSILRKINSEGSGSGRNTSDKGQQEGTGGEAKTLPGGGGERRALDVLNDYKELSIRKAAAERAKAYILARSKSLQETYGLKRDEPVSYETIDRIFNDYNSDPEVKELYDSIVNSLRSLGTEFYVGSIELARTKGYYKHSENFIKLNVDRLSAAGYTKQDLASTLCHEMLHPLTSDIIAMYQKGHTDKLSPSQIEAAKDAVDIYNELIKMQKEGKLEDYYGLENPREMITELASPEWRSALRKIPAAKKWYQKLINAICRMIGKDPKYNKLGEMERTLTNLLDNFGKEQFDFASQNENELFKDEYQGYKVTDKDELDRLNKEKTFRMYSGMQEVDGKLYSPMAAIIDGKRTDATEIGAWMGADERPDLVKNGKFQLVKTDKNPRAGEGPVPAAYNPYMHTSTSMMNDQFTGAYARGNIKVVEWEIPESEKTSGYHAEGAKDSVGLVPWHSGSVNSLLPKDRQRQVMLSRWRKAVRVVPDSEVAESIAEQLKGTGLAIPWNVVTPNQVRELAKLGVPITTVESGRQAPETKEKFLKQMVELEQEFPQAKFVNVKMTKDSYKEWGNDGGTKFRTNHGDGNYPASSVENHVEKVAQKTGAKVNMVSSVDEITNKAARAAIEEGRKITGWYDEKTGEVHLYMPNIHDRYTAEKTIWHEVVGHKGMRELFGEDRFNQFLRDVWYDLDKPENAELKKLVDEERKFNPLNIYDAIEEGIARLAEDGKGEPGFWNGIKNKVSDFLHEIGYRIAPNTKDVKYLLWLSKNLQKNPNDPYWKLRAEAVKYRLDHDRVPAVVERNGMYFDNDGKSHDYLLDLNRKDFEEATDGKVHFRTSPMTASKIEEYNRRLGTKLYAFKESTVDNMQSLQEAMEIISGEKNAWTDIPSAFNPLQAQNRIDSIVQQKAEEYDRKYTKPLDDSFKKVVSTMSGSDKDEQLRNAQIYMITKHGLERNRVFFVRDAIRDMMNGDVTKAKTLMKDWNDKQKDLADELEKGNIRFDEYLEQMDEWIRSNVDVNFVADEHDYSGFHGMQNIAKTSDPYDDKLAIDNVMSAESQMGSDLAKDFWIKKKAATDYVIDQEYYNGFIDQSDRDYLKGMFQWYVPLRKFDDTTAEDVYGYIGEKGDTSNFVGPVLANAKGRSSLSDINVMAQISAMAKSSLINGGKNVVKQHFARFVSAYETGNTKDKIFVEVNPWLEKHVVDGNEVWEEVTPQIPENATQQQISNILQNFEDSMQAKKATGDAKLSHRKPNIGFKFQRAKDKSEHIIDVYIAGRKRSFVCQGNPRAAQALNGLLKDSGTRNAVTQFDAKVTRKIAQFNTSLNPDFMMSNMLRDLTFASANVTKEGFSYTKDFLKEYAGNMISIKNGKGSGNYLTMFRKYRDGKLDTNNERERMFKEFMDNGGQTGFVQIKKLESLIEEYDNLIKKGSKDADGWFVKKIKEGGTFIETANEIIENVARYSTYCTSRKHGRSVGRSIYDAKEVSTNFNRHGSGDAIKTLKTSNDSNIDKKFRGTLGFFNSWMKNHTQFYNAGVQGANLFFKNYKSAWKTSAVSFGMLPLGLGIAQALINQYLINNEDEKDRKGVKDPYAELPEWKRRNNICIYTGHGNFKTIPIAIELRAFFGLGDIAAGYVVNDKLKSSTPIGYDILGQMAQLVPASDFLGHHSPSNNIKELGEDAILAVTPTTISPAMELAFNRDWTGRPFYRDYDYLDKAPRWKRAYDNTNGIYMSINKWANQGTNSIDSSNADMKGNETLDYLTAPYAWQHLIDSYTGGMGSTIGRTYKTLEAVGKGVVSGAKNKEGFSKGFSDEFEKFDKNQIPLYRVFNYTPKEGQDMQRTRSKWYNYSDELKQTEYNIKQLKTNTPDVLKNMENNAKKFNFTHGKEGKAYNIWEAADSYISKKKRQLNKASNPEVIKSINEDINRKMQEAVNDLDKLN